MLRKVFGGFAVFFVWIFYSALAYIFYYYLFGSILMLVGTTNQYAMKVYLFVFENTYPDIANIVMGLLLGGLYTYAKWNED